MFEIRQVSITFAEMERYTFLSAQGLEPISSGDGYDTYFLSDILVKHGLSPVFLRFVGGDMGVELSVKLAHVSEGLRSFAGLYQLGPAKAVCLERYRAFISGLGYEPEFSNAVLRYYADGRVGWCKVMCSDGCKQITIDCIRDLFTIREV